MAKRKQKPSTDDDDLFIDDGASGDGSDDDAEDLAALDIDDAFDEDEGDLDPDRDQIDVRSPSKRLMTKRRLDAYLERKWFRENGWDDDDDLFDDEFFKESGNRRS